MQDSYIIRVQCGGQAAYEVTIKAVTGGDAVTIAKRQNPGCTCVLLRKAK
ncbi:hypothetical protein [Magnetospirillum sulfuroxidans]|uniref:Uncharacterized protein n=1 Tax=Magnetospirillum sulfuroxidans TaxID=611300 RepID=A0ABS5ICN4_9PROT|nr:hypothetical protein [Magnetospirillum sulfuroxidans]MBR9972046.1 hypothetical protein [Magnetospirillum sulfuroxidans]